MHILLFDTSARSKLFPLTFTRAIADLRMGMFTFKERWELLSSGDVFVLTAPYLQSKYRIIPPGEYLFVDASIFPTVDLLESLKNINSNEALHDSNGLIAARINFTTTPVFDFDISSLINDIIICNDVKRLAHPHQISQFNAELIIEDFSNSDFGVQSLNNYDTVRLINPSQIYIEEGASISTSVLNATEGPIYIGKNTTIMDGCLIRGPFVLCEGATLKMGTKIYGGTTLGPYCVAGGEIKNSVLTGFSNKAHDGYLGDSVIGEWCNLGAGTSNSNVKNTGGDIKVWNYSNNDYINIGTKAGVIMGDYSRTAINSSINTGTVIGVSSNIFGDGLTPKHIKNFNWGSSKEIKYEFDKAVKDISNWKKMKNKHFTHEEENILRYIYDNYN